MRRFCVLLAVVVAGCSKADPEGSRLPPGTRVMLHSPTDEEIPLMLVQGLIANTPIGTEAVVASDDSKDKTEYREVVIKMTDGPAAGRVGTVYRVRLRPMP